MTFLLSNTLLMNTLSNYPTNTDVYVNNNLSLFLNTLISSNIYTNYIYRYTNKYTIKNFNKYFIHKYILKLSNKYICRFQLFNRMFYLPTINHCISYTIGNYQGVGSYVLFRIYYHI